MRPSPLLSLGYKISHLLPDDSSRVPIRGDEFGVLVHFEGKLIGSAYFRHEGSALIPSDDDGNPSVIVHENHRRKGVASWMYSYAEELCQVSVMPSQGRTEEGKSFWAQSTRKFGKT